MSKADRSKHMSRIQGRNTEPERRLRLALYALGFRYRLHVRALPGCPDIVLPKFRAAIFVNGCFWHRHARCRLAYSPKSRIVFWEKKFSATKLRDQRQKRALRSLGWHVLVVWECTTRDRGRLQEEVGKVASALQALDDASGKTLGTRENR